MFIYLIEAMDFSKKCSISGCNVTAYSSSLAAVQSFPDRTKFDWIDNTALIQSAKGLYLGWCSKVKVNRR